MIPKVSRFRYHYYSSALNVPEKRASLLQLFVEANTFHENPNLSQEELDRLSRFQKLCSTAFYEDWDSRYGAVRYFLTFEDDQQVTNHLKNFAQSLHEIGDEATIKLIDASLNFHQEHIGKFTFLRTHSTDDPEWAKVIEDLEDKYEFHYSYSAVVALTNMIVEDPNHYCIGTDGHLIDKKYTGQLDDYYNDGSLHERYSFVD